MTLDPVFLSRLQFAWVIGWHRLLPAFTVGLAAFVAFLKRAFLFTRREVFIDLSRFWLRIFVAAGALVLRRRRHQPLADVRARAGHMGLGHIVHADQRIPVADGASLAADMTTPKTPGR